MSKENKKEYYVFELDLKVLNIFSLILLLMGLPLCLLIKDFNILNINMLVFFIINK